MLVTITLDKIDGSQSKIKTCYADEFNFNALVFKLMESDVVGFTVTKRENILKIAEKVSQNDNAKNSQKIDV